MSKLIKHLETVTDPTELEEIGDDIGFHFEHTPDDVLKVPHPLVMRGKTTGDRINLVLVEECESGNTYHVVYVDGYIEKYMGGDQVDRDYILEAVQTIRIFPLN